MRCSAPFEHSKRRKLAMASTPCLPQKTKIPRPDRRGKANRIHPSLGTLIKHGVFIPGDRMVYHEYTCKITEDTTQFQRRIALNLHECPWLLARLKCLENTECPTISYAPSKEAPTQLLMSPSTFKLVADWAREGYPDDYAWKQDRMAWTSRHLVVKTMGGREVREGYSLGDVRNFFAEDVDWNYSTGRAQCKPKITCRKHFVRSDRPESDFSRLVHFLMDVDDEESVRVDEDEDEEYVVVKSIQSRGSNSHSPHFNSQAPSTSSGIFTRGEVSEGESGEDDEEGEDDGDGNMMQLDLQHDDS